MNILNKIFNFFNINGFLKRRHVKALTKHLDLNLNEEDVNRTIYNAIKETFKSNSPSDYLYFPYFTEPFSNFGKYKSVYYFLIYEREDLYAMNNYNYIHTLVDYMLEKKMIKLMRINNSSSLLNSYRLNEAYERSLKIEKIAENG